MEKRYVTTAIYYANGAPHIGHALELVQADAYARWYRQQGARTFFQTGTDEHGAKIARAAEKAGMPPQQFVDSIAAQFAALKEPLMLSWDRFFRTTDRVAHWPGVQEIWRKLEERGDIYRRKYRGLYCVGHEAFVTEKDLVDGKCVDHGEAPEIIEEENYFFRLSRYGKEIQRAIASDEMRILPAGRKEEMLAFLSRGLEDVSFSRPRKDLAWGIPVPGDESQTIYVWADALTNYLSGVGYPREEFREWWPADIHFIGKDILRFHALIWPGILIAAGLPLPRNIFVHGFLTVEGKKMSKTLGNVIHPAKLVEEYGVDAVRYYLLRSVPSGEDGDVSKERLQHLLKGELADGLGNFASRVCALAGREGTLKVEKLDASLKKILDNTRKEVAAKMNQFQIHEALGIIWKAIQEGDIYINRNAPWKSRDKKVIAMLVVLLSEIAQLVAPFLPKTSASIRAAIHLDGDALTAKPLAPLFPKRNAGE